MSENETDVLVAVEDFKAFFRCGGVLLPESILLWRSLAAEEKAAMLEATEQIAAENAALLAIAMTSPEGAAQVYSKVDGGDSVVRRGLLNAVAKAVVR